MLNPVEHERQTECQRRPQWLPEPGRARRHERFPEQGERTQSHQHQPHQPAKHVAAEPGQVERHEVQDQAATDPAATSPVDADVDAQDKSFNSIQSQQEAAGEQRAAGRGTQGQVPEQDEGSIRSLRREQQRHER